MNISAIPTAGNTIPLALRDRNHAPGCCGCGRGKRYPYADHASRTLAENVNGKETEIDPYLDPQQGCRNDAYTAEHAAGELSGHRFPLIEHDPATWVRELMFDADQLNFFLSDKARSQEYKIPLLEEKEGKEQEKKPKKEKDRNRLNGSWMNQVYHPEPVEKKLPPVSVNAV